MKIAVFTDLRFVSNASPTGVGKHIEQMVGGIARDKANEVNLLAARDQYTNPDMRWPNVAGAIRVRRLPLPWKVAEALWTLSGMPAADAYCEGADWVYCPKNDYIPLRVTRLAVTVHGAHELDPQMPKPLGMAAGLNRMRRRLSYRRIAEGAGLLLTVSEFLKRQIVDWFSVDPDAVVVVGNGVETCYFRAAEEPEGASGRSPDRPYLLCVGGLNELDGAALTLDVAETLARTDPDVLIIIAGQQHEDRFLVRARNLKNLELAGYVPANRLAALMRDARGLLYLPRYETFGIAAAEAMAVGTPVVTTGGTAVPEVVGGAALTVRAVVDEIAEGVRLLVNDTSAREALRGAGRERARRFSWQSCVDRLIVALGGTTA